jgi:hypothetical protein
MTPVLARVTVFAVFERAPRAIHVPCRRLSLRPCLRIERAQLAFWEKRADTYLAMLHLACGLASASPTRAPLSGRTAKRRGDRAEAQGGDETTERSGCG